MDITCPGYESGSAEDKSKELNSFDHSKKDLESSRTWLYLYCLSVREEGRGDCSQVLRYHRAWTTSSSETREHVVHATPPPEQEQVQRVSLSCYDA